MNLLSTNKNMMKYVDLATCEQRINEALEDGDWLAVRQVFEQSDQDAQESSLEGDD
jgi:hypothetical protein